MGVCAGGGDSDAKPEIFQFSPFFSKMSFRRGGGGGVCYTFLKSPGNGRFGKVWVRGGGGGRWPYFFVPDPNFLAFWCLLQKSGLVWSGLVCIQGFTVLGPVLQHVVSMANISDNSKWCRFLCRIHW